MAKLNRERALLERRELKRAKKEARKRASVAHEDAGPPAPSDGAAGDAGELRA
jgi:hypothetical protein